MSTALFGWKQGFSVLLETRRIQLDEIYVPVKRRKTLDEGKVEAIAESIIENGQRNSIQVRRDKDRYVLVTGYHRLEALRALGEKTIRAVIIGST